MRILVLLTALATLGVAWGRSTVTLGELSGAQVAPQAISGFNYGNMMRVVGWEERFAALNLTNIRFPPGNVADEHALNRAALEALLQNWRLLGQPEVTFVVNLFTGDPHQTRQAVTMLLEAEVPVTLWELGNEPDLFASNRKDPSWTPQRYCREFRSHGAAIRELVPDALLAGPGVSGSRPSALDYLREVLTACGDVIDVLTFHLYPTDGTWSDAEALATSSLATDEIGLLRTWLRDPTVNPLGHERHIPLGVTEFGLSWRTPNYRHLEDVTATLWLADTLGRLAVEGVSVSHYFALQGLGGHGLLDTSGWVRPTWHLYHLLAGFRGQILPATVTHAPGVSAYASYDAGRLTLLLVNRSAADVELSLELPGEAASLRQRTISQASYEISDEPLETELTSLSSVLLPALSATVLDGALMGLSTATGNPED